MKKLLVAVMVLVVPIFISTGAWALTVNDQEGVAGAYYGGTYHEQDSNTGIWSTPSYTHDIDPNDSSSYQWSVTGLTATQVATTDGPSISVVLSGSYFGTNYANPGVLTLGGKPGDLYISSTGWHTSSGSVADHWASDTFIADPSNPKYEGWNYVVGGFGDPLKLKSHISYGNGDKWTYNATLYNLTNGYSPTSMANGPNNYFRMYRSDQAWQGGYGDVVTTNATVILDTTGTTPTLTFSFLDVPGWNPDQIGYHWAISCGNDVVEGGGTPVPEPGSLLLLGLGLAGLGVYRRKAARG